jgi:murein DD-endopeptidase MepM/ murein hydrolase activator NlpD
LFQNLSSRNFVVYPMKWCVLFFVLFLFSCGKQFRFAGKGATADTSYIYRLPYPEGKSHLVVQGYNSRFSHRGRLGLDFKMRSGSPITAVRSGVVTALQEGNTKGGVSRKYYRQANSVTIRHSDGTMSFYGHLQHNGVVVNVGDTVQQGQLIARSGSTGYSALPHLHFSLWKPNATGRRTMLPTRFYTQKGVQYLRPGRWYKAPSQTSVAGLH